MASIPAYAQPAFVEFVSAHAAKGDPDAERLLSRLPKKGKRKELDPKISAKGPTKAQSDRAAYDAVEDRDAGLCTIQLAGFGECDGALQTDHQWGRGKEPTKVENCRKLCRKHHQMKTDGNPSRLLWLCDFREHALSHDYYAEVAKADGQIALERAQHPERLAVRSDKP